MKIGNITLENNVILAPMAGVTDLPYRKIAKEMGAGLVYTELISAKGIYYENDATIEMMRIDESERPVSLQIFGSEANIMGEIAKKIEGNNFDILDINMGCPAPKIVRSGDGCALMKDPKKIREIVTNVVKSTKKPVTVKIRKGFDLDNINAVEVSKIIEDCGAAAIAVHGRTRSQFYSGVADWDIIKQVKEAVKIPVIGNGDIDSPQKAQDMLDSTGCDGIMIGRGATGNPFIFREIVHYLKTGELLPVATQKERIHMALRHARMLIDYKGEYIGVREMRKHIGWYTKSIPNSAKLRYEINHVESYKEIEELMLKNLFSN